jgi:hypothetical protein
MGLHKHLWQGLVIVLSSLSGGNSCVGGLGGCFLWGRENTVFIGYIYIQGVPGGKDNTSGGCSLGQTIPI